MPVMETGVNGSLKKRISFENVFSRRLKDFRISFFVLSLKGSSTILFLARSRVVVVSRVSLECTIISHPLPASGSGSLPDSVYRRRSADTLSWWHRVWISCLVYLKFLQKVKILVGWNEPDMPSLGECCNS